MLLLEIDEQSRKPHYQQIVEQIQEKIENQMLPPGEKLPSTRRLAEHLGLHRSTVASAYQELWALGFVDLRPGACPKVRERMQLATVERRTPAGVVNWSAIASKASNAVWQTSREWEQESGRERKETGIDFSNLNIDYRLFPLDHFRSCLNQAIREHGLQLLGYGERAGFSPLREYIARHLQGHGISVTAEEILITNGLQQGIDLVFRMIAEPGKAVAIESPTYSEIIPLLRFCGLKPIEIPMRSDGMDLDVLEQAIAREKPVLVYTMPNFQNPTGVSTNQAHRERLLSICQQHRIPILEDGFEEEMKYFGRVVLPIKSMDKEQLVIYCGTFSKVLFPGVRIGWIAADKECIARLISIRSFSDLSSSMILQAGIYDFCQNGHYERHISKMHRLFRKRMQTMLEVLQREIKPAWASWREPSGGYLVWLKLAELKGKTPDLPEILRRHGVHAAFGDSFFLSKSADLHLRLSISQLNEAEIVRGIECLAQALAEVYG
ncbi:PLP-dependent aminotransferase family protein [Azotosporobacter soli]|uniref:MocR-like pyridoxine biosynthesis transcription factor PdxR n=1 Tax=Azotosporobacter soli TaxID=3055040 RepID=UPI0031FEE779